jgi:hypothetical protein
MALAESAPPRTAPPAPDFGPAAEDGGTWTAAEVATVAHLLHTVRGAQPTNSEDPMADQNYQDAGFDPADDFELAEAIGGTGVDDFAQTVGQAIAGQMQAQQAPSPEAAQHLELQALAADAIERADARLAKGDRPPLPALTPHSLRRTFISVLLTLGEAVPS